MEQEHGRFIELATVRWSDATRPATSIARKVPEKATCASPTTEPQAPDFPRLWASDGLPEGDMMPKTKPCEVFGYTHYNYAVLHGTGVADIFDFIRYNYCFLARRSDLDMLLEAAEEYGRWVNRQYAVLLCRYDWLGKTKAHWEYQKLLTDQKLEECSDLQTLSELGSYMEVLRAKPKLKWRHELVTTGTLPELLKIMYDHRAIPANEEYGNRLTLAFYSPEKEITVTLATFLETETPSWRVPI